jgi:LysR family transcriptional activator of nhaA
MDWLNYHHLFYFWTVAREGSITAASKQLLLSPPTISAQIRELEQALGEKFFDRSGRGLSLTEAGQVAFRYANEIFGLGREFVDAIKGHSTLRSIRIGIGINDVIPKQIAYQLIEPVFRMAEPVRVECIQGTPAQLLPSLAVHELDVVLSDAPMSPDIRIRAYNHLLGESTIKVFAAAALAKKLRKGFPKSLDKAPVLLPPSGSAMRIILEKWFESIRVRPAIVGEFEDITLLKICGEHARGFFGGYGIMEEQNRRTFRSEVVGTVKGYHVGFYAISIERQIRNPAVLAITTAARQQLFS